MEHTTVTEKLKKVRIKLDEIEVEVESNSDSLEDVKKIAEEIMKKIKMKKTGRCAYIG